MFDSKVLPSAVIWPDSKPAAALSQARRNGNVPLSSEVFAELCEVLARKRFRRYIDPEDVEEFLEALASESLLVDVDVEISACRDPKDDKFLSLAVSGGATRIVTGDQDLLALDPFQGIRIVTPRDSLK